MNDLLGLYLLRHDLLALTAERYHLKKQINISSETAIIYDNFLGD
jgi:hypothetical protein